MSYMKFRRSVLSGNVDAAEHEIGLGVLVDQPDKFGRTALMYSANVGNLQMVKFLLRKKANVEARDFQCRTALMDSAMEGHSDIVRLLVKEYGADVNAANKYGATALIYAAHEGRALIASILIDDLGADVNACDSYGDTPVIIASRWGRFETVRYLVQEAKANLSHRGRENRTALEWSEAKVSEFTNPKDKRYFHIPGENENKVASPHVLRPVIRERVERHEAIVNFLWEATIKPTKKTIERDVPHSLRMLDKEIIEATFGRKQLSSAMSNVLSEDGDEGKGTCISTCSPGKSKKRKTDAVNDETSSAKRVRRSPKK
mmetsp:Transcript_4441/g.6644  ORF Transcript_4441/g.6644 Transcript_4441/m.6644 type:complete len:317 (+) Transcript_4441:16-966(+)|eukprot:CAMPEP_0167748004 /NCGR_PEP_ID=MMETSP0110_2-20121227/4598_1 /TAXON_ID=629695 /ORGANISM="Gymnochlora sp., Strain CCMP2014" /LENGTH=316 /DNA_ID=CAMNT_0007632973 /DNA_START=62 /DNA_END=1012 /DNA_ORIENTATION=+